MILVTIEYPATGIEVFLSESQDYWVVDRNEDEVEILSRNGELNQDTESQWRTESRLLSRNGEQGRGLQIY